MNVNEEKMKVHIGGRLFNDQRYFVDGNLLKELGWKKKINFEEGLKSTIQWYLNKMDNVKRI